MICPNCGKKMSKWVYFHPFLIKHKACGADLQFKSYYFLDVSMVFACAYLFSILNFPFRSAILFLAVYYLVFAIPLAFLRLFIKFEISDLSENKRQWTIVVGYLAIGIVILAFIRDLYFLQFG